MVTMAAMILIAGEHCNSRQVSAVTIMPSEVFDCLQLVFILYFSGPRIKTEILLYFDRFMPRVTE